MNRDQAITHLTTNCACWKGKKDVLTNKQTFTDEEVIRLATEHQASTLAINTLQEVGKTIGAPSTLAINAMPAFIKSKVAAATTAEADAEDAVDGGVDDAEEDASGQVVKKKPVAMPMMAATNTKSTADWLAEAPPEAREMLNGLIANERAAKTELINKLVSNARTDVIKARLTNTLSTKPLNELRDLLELMPVSNKKMNDPLVNYFGAAGGNNDVEVENSIVPDGVEYDGQWPHTVAIRKQA